MKKKRILEGYRHKDNHNFMIVCEQFCEAEQVLKAWLKACGGPPTGGWGVKFETVRIEIDEEK